MANNSFLDMLTGKKKKRKTGYADVAKVEGEPIAATGPETFGGAAVRGGTGGGKSLRETLQEKKKREAELLKDL